ncbi:hypothetical protein ABZR88_12200 [Mucilaginibacter yixingensis]|nr:hypothetical protein [Mucilaginibacter yixingensis]
MELDQLYKKLNYPVKTRLEFLAQKQDTVIIRDDLYLENAALYNYSGLYAEALQLIDQRKFHPWEGGEGKASGQYIYALTELAKADIRAKRFTEAIDKLEQAQVYPHNLGEGKLPGAQENDLFYWLGCAYKGLGDEQHAAEYWHKATVGLSEPSAAIFYNDQQPDKIYYQGLAWRELGQPETADKIFTDLVNYGNGHKRDEVRIDYFAVSLPDLLIFDDDLNLRNAIHCEFVAGLGYLGRKAFAEAEIAFNSVFEKDAMHFGARTHLRDLLLLKEKMNLLNVVS